MSTFKVWKFKNDNSSHLALKTSLPNVSGTKVFVHSGGSKEKKQSQNGH
jgi:hypothetical protein